MRRRMHIAGATLVSAIVAGGMFTARDASAQTGWPSGGHDLQNSRHQPYSTLTARNVSGLLKKWEVTTAGDVTASPAIDGDYLYFPDSAGFLYKVHRKTGAVAWQRPVSDYTGIPGDFARATPAVSGDRLVLGSQSGRIFSAPQPARVFAVDKHTGAALWSTQVDSTTMSYVTTAAVIVNGVAITGVASNEELIAGFVPKAFWTWYFRGSVVALDVATGAQLWKTYTVPQGYYGGGVWGSTPAVDLDTNQVFVATGNNYMVPQSALDCLTNGGTPGACLSPDNHFNSIIALDLKTGAIRWARKGLSYDAWNVGCGLGVPGFVVPPNDNCPSPAGPDWDFAQGPMLFSDDSSGKKTMVGAGQKSGMFWAFRISDGAPAWSRQVAPGGVTGGLQWGSATNGKTIYVAVANSGPSTNGGGVGALPWTLKNGTTVTSGGWAALEARTGKVEWTTADPLGSRAEGAVSLANDVVFGCNLDFARGTMYALDARTGTPLWSFDSGGACNAAPSIFDDMVFWGTGTFAGFGPKKVFGFSLN